MYGTEDSGPIDHPALDQIAAILKASPAIGHVNRESESVEFWQGADSRRYEVIVREILDDVPEHDLDKA